MTIFIIFVIFIVNNINKINMYKITIEKIEDVNLTNKHWKQLREPFKGEETMTEEELKSKPQYGYVEVEVTEKNITKVFEVMLDDIDVAEVATKIISK